VGHGTGLGLATAYGIVDQSGGQITVSSRPGDGSTIYGALPPASPAPADVEARPARVPSSPEDTTILLVEDEDSVRRLTKYALERKGYRVLDAARGPEALAHRECGFDRPHRHRCRDARDVRAGDGAAVPRVARARARGVHVRLRRHATFQAGALAMDEGFSPNRSSPQLERVCEEGAERRAPGSTEKRMGVAGSNAHSFTNSIDESSAGLSTSAPAVLLLMLGHLSDVGIELHALFRGQDCTDRRVLLSPTRFHLLALLAHQPLDGRRVALLTGLADRR
jgi:hypothetical protein